MNCQLLSKEDNKVKIEVVVAKEEFEKYVDLTFKKSRGRFNIQGFRKGKAPRKIIEMNYGEGVFYDDALNALLPVEYDKAVKELELSPINRPDIDIVEIGKDVDLKFTADVEVKPEIVLGEYFGLEVEKPKTEVTEEALAEELQKSVEMNARMVVVEDRDVMDGDILTIDYKGFIGEDQFEGGTAENQTLNIGSGEFIPGFEEQLIGAKIGDDVKVNVTFPEDYQSEALAGAEAVFEVKVHEIKVKELPELDDEFAKDTSEFDTLEELKADTLKRLKEQNESSAESFIKNKVVDLAVDNVEMVIPEVMIDSEVDFMVKEQMKEDAAKRVKTQMVIEKIAEVAAVEVTQEEIDAEMERISKTQDTPIEEVKKVYGRDDYAWLKDTLKSTKVVEMMAEKAKIVD